MPYPKLRSLYPEYAGIRDDGAFLNAVHQGKFPKDSDDDFISAASSIEDEGSAAGPHDAPGRPGGESGGAIPAAITTPAEVFMAVPKMAWKMAGDFATDAANIPRGLVVNPLKQTFQNRKATPEEEKQSLSGLAGLVGLLSAGPVGKVGAAATERMGGGLLAKMISGAGVGGALGAEDSAIRSGGDLKAVPGGALGGAALGGALAPILPAHVDADPVNAARTVGGRIAAQGRPGKAIAERVDRSVQEGLIGGGKVSAKLVDAGFGKLTAHEDEQLGDALRGRFNPATLTGRVRAVYDVLEPWRRDVAQRTTNLKVMVNRGGQKVPFAARPNHVPQMIPDLAAPEKVVAAMAKEGVKNGSYATESMARAAWADYKKFVQTAGRKGGDIVAKKLVDSGQARDMAHARGMLLRSAKASTIKRQGSLEFSRMVDLGLYDPSPSRIYPRHIEGVERRLSEIGHLGQENEKIGKLLGYVKDDEERALLTHLSRVAMGAHEPGDPKLQGLLDLGRKAALFKFSPFTTVKNLGQTANTFLASDVPSFVRGTAKAFTKEGKRLALESGAASESAIHNVEHEVGSESNAAGKFLKAIGFTGVERGINRRIAPNVGAEMAKKYAGKLAKNPADEFAANELRRLGLDPGRVQASGLTHDDVLRAALDLTHRTQFRSHALDLPAMANESNLGRATAQFKTFGYQHGKFVADEIAGRFASGSRQERVRALRNLAILGTVYPMTGEAINDVIALAKGEKRKSQGLQRWAENIGSTGGVGIAGDLAQTVTQYGKGDRGGALMKALGPPSLAMGVEATQMLADMKARQDAGKPLTPYQKKWLVRQIPGVGPIAAARMKQENQQAR